MNQLFQTGGSIKFVIQVSHIGLDNFLYFIQSEIVGTFSYGHLFGK